MKQDYLNILDALLKHDYINAYLKIKIFLNDCLINKYCSAEQLNNEYVKMLELIIEGNIKALVEILEKFHNSIIIKSEK